jgi:rSAM/selenodomain-associated transferase 1
MRSNQTIAVIIPALNEAASIGRVIAEIPDWVDDVIVADNGSTDGTADAARDATNGTIRPRVVGAPRRGYGSACQVAIAALHRPDVVVFLDADASDYPGEMERLVDPIVNDDADIVIGSRVLGHAEPGALTPQQRWGNWLATRLIRLFWGMRFTDLGPFRAVRYTTLVDLGMCDPDFGWTVELQIKAARRRLRAIEAPVGYRRRIGVSKISGTVRGVLAAGHKILYTIFRAVLRPEAADPGRRPRLIVFSKWPEPGRVKTRMIEAIGPEAAADLHRAMTRHTMVWARRFAHARAAELEVRGDGADGAAFRNWLGHDLRCVGQGPGNLGARLTRAFAEAFADGRTRVVIVGADCPDLNETLAARAVDALNDRDLVVGPSRDGGYYLIALRRAVPALFEGIGWGGDQVLAVTLERAARFGLRVHRLPELSDVDTPGDLGVWEKHAGG